MNKKLLLISLLLAAFLINLDTTIVNVALPSLTRQLYATTTQLQWIVDAYNLAFAALLLSAGSLSDRLGRRKMLIAGLTIFGLASLVGSFSGTITQLIVARSIMGLGAAMTFPATLSLITNVFRERRERALAIGLWGATGGAAIALGPIVGGWLLAQYSWASIFVSMSPVALLAIIMVGLFVKESKNSDSADIDAVGLGLSALGMASLVFTIIEAPIYGWLAMRSIGGFGVALLLISAFVGRERRTPSPMIDVRLFKNGRFSAASAAVTISFFTLFGFTFLMTQFFQFTRHYSALSTGVHLLPVAVSVAVGSIIGTGIALRKGTKAVVTIGMLLVAGVYAWVAKATSATLSYDIIAIQMVLYGLGLGLTSAPATESIMGAVQTAKAGVGSAINDTTRLVGGTLGVAVIGSIFASLYQNRISHAYLLGLSPVARSTMKQSVGAGYTAAAKASLSHPAVGRVLADATTNALLHGLRTSCLVAAGIALFGAVSTLLFLPAKPAE